MRKLPAAEPWTSGHGPPAVLQAQSFATLGEFCVSNDLESRENLSTAHGKLSFHRDEQVS